jgi:hypothetical protein
MTMVTSLHAASSSNGWGGARPHPGSIRRAHRDRFRGSLVVRQPPGLSRTGQLSGRPRTRDKGAQRPRGLQPLWRLCDSARHPARRQAGHVQRSGSTADRRRRWLASDRVHAVQRRRRLHRHAPRSRLSRRTGAQRCGAGEDRDHRLEISHLVHLHMTGGFYNDDSCCFC